MQLVWYVFSFLTVFSAITVIHELGHYLVAKRYGVKVYEFSLGYPLTPVVITLFSYRETAFTVRWLPVGGFCRFAWGGGKPWNALRALSPVIHARLILGGPVASILVGLLIFEPSYASIHHVGHLEAIAQSCRVMGEVFWGTFSMLFGFLGPAAAHAGTIGPLGVAHYAYMAVQFGPAHLCALVGGFSMAFGFFNMLPFPGLDGGHLVVMAYERVRGAQLDDVVYERILRCSLILLSAGIAYSVWSDLVMIAVR